MLDTTHCLFLFKKLDHKINLISFGGFYETAGENFLQININAC